MECRNGSTTLLLRSEDLPNLAVASQPGPQCNLPEPTWFVVAQIIASSRCPANQRTGTEKATYLLQ